MVAKLISHEMKIKILDVMADLPNPEYFPRTREVALKGRQLLISTLPKVTPKNLRQAKKNVFEKTSRVATRSKSKGSASSQNNSATDEDDCNQSSSDREENGSKSPGQGPSQTRNGALTKANDPFQDVMDKQKMLFRENARETAELANSFNAFRVEHRDGMAVLTEKVTGLGTILNNECDALKDEVHELKNDVKEIKQAVLSGGQNGGQVTMVSCKCACESRLTLTVNTLAVEGSTHYQCPRCLGRFYKTLTGLVSHIRNGTQKCGCKC